MFQLKFIIILFIAFVDYMGIGLVYPIFGAMLFDSECPFIAADASSAYRGAILGILMGLTPLSAFVFSPFLGSFSDCGGRKKTLIFGMVCGCLGYFLAIAGIFLHSLALLFFFRALVGITEGTAAVAQAALADISTEETKGRRFSLFNSSAGLGFTIGPFIGGKLASSEISWGFGYSTPFLFAGVLCLINLAAIWLFFSETRVLEKKLSFRLSDSIRNLSKVWTWSHLTPLFATGFLLSFSWALFNEFMPVHLKENFAFSLSEIGNYFAWGGFWYFISSAVLAGPLLVRFQPERILFFALCGCAVTMAAFSVFEEARSIWVMVPPLMYFLSLTFPSVASLVSNRTAVDSQGEVLGVYYSLQGCAMGLSPILGGPIIGALPNATGISGAIIMVLAFCSLWIGTQRKVQEEV